MAQKQVDRDTPVSIPPTSSKPAAIIATSKLGARVRGEIGHRSIGSASPSRQKKSKAENILLTSTVCTTSRN
jgi:hypothetical protein